VPYATLPVLNPYIKGIALGRRHYLLISNDDYSEVKDSRLVRNGIWNKTKQKTTVAQFQLLHDGKIACARIESNPGVYLYKNVEDFINQNPDTLLLKGEPCTSIHFDKNGGTWVTSYKNGIFYRPNQNIALWDKQSGLLDEHVLCLAPDEKGQLYFSDGEQNLYCLNLRDHQTREIDRGAFKGHTIKYLLYDTLENRLVLGSPLLFFEKNKWHVNFIRSSRFVSNRVLASRDNLFYWNIGSRGIGKHFRSNGKMVLSAILNGTRFKSICETPDGRIWVSDMQGLKELVPEKDTMQVVPNRPEPLTRQINQMRTLPDGTLIAGTATGGICIWKENQFFRQITENDGLTLNQVKCFILQADTILWVGTNAGLNKITGWHDGATLRVEPITDAHGLPSNQINQLCIIDDAVWIASGAGLIKYGAKPKALVVAAPFLSHVLMQDKVLKLTGHAHSFSYAENNLDIHFYTLNYAQNGHILYRFRLDERAAWQTTFATHALFSALAPNHYRFEVQSQNEDGVWSASTVFPFTVRPPWWSDWPFRLLMLAALIGAGFAFYQWRTKALKSEFALQNQLSELEQTALRAQMNPHFIANCLNSIQRCVLEKENEAAVSYLARFAKLTRSALEFSGRPQITVAEELIYLQNYIELEKLRFKQKFEFTIKVDDAIEVHKTFLPPTLVQPLVENAIVHGLAQTRVGGLLEIYFTKSEKGLRVQCLDNGNGLPEGINNLYQEGHALSLIHRRLALLKKTGHNHTFSIQNRQDGHKGTSALLLFEIGNELHS
jgi:Histidine kinase/Y_Y_Y domain/Two component regulator propeller